MSEARTSTRRSLPTASMTLILAYDRLGKASHRLNAANAELDAAEREHNAAVRAVEQLEQRNVRS